MKDQNENERERGCDLLEVEMQAYKGLGKTQECHGRI